jgi:choline dehydrogenase-like flavoprotein
MVATESAVGANNGAVKLEGLTRASPSAPHDESVTDDRRVIVIGSGPAGATAAWALSAQGVPVTLLESGQVMPRGLLVRAMGRNILRVRPSAEELNRHLASDDPDARWYQALRPGGMSNHWAGAVPRFAPEDFTEGERLHERYRWPVTYADLVPYYARIERLMHIVGSRRDVHQMPAPAAAGRRSGLDRAAHRGRLQQFHGARPTAPAPAGLPAAAGRPCPAPELE